MTVAPLLERAGDWRAFLRGGVEEAALEAIRGGERTGRPLGSPDFVADLEAQTGRALAPKKRGPAPRGGEERRVKYTVPGTPEKARPGATGWGGRELSILSPELIVAYHGVEHLSHAGDDGDLGLLSICDEAFVEFGNHRVVAAGGQRRHVEGGANIRPAAPDGS